MDREKIIKGLEEISDYFFDVYHHSKDIEEINKAKNRCDVVEDVIALLKKQEPVKPIRLENWWKCPSCSGNIVANMKYCPRCGRKVKWE